MMELGKKLPWYLNHGLDVTGQGLAKDGEYFGHVLRIFGDFLVSTVPLISHYGSSGIAIHKSAWNQFRVVKPV